MYSRVLSLAAYKEELMFEMRLGPSTVGIQAGYKEAQAATALAAAAVATASVATGGAACEVAGTAPLTRMTESTRANRNCVALRRLFVGRLVID
jgi:hypothetical protein